MNRPLLSDPTPTTGPWKYAGWDAVGCDVYRSGDSPAECDKVATVAREADANLICLAVNAHADLLAACRLMLDRIDGSYSQVMYAAIVMRAAVAKATGVAETPDE